MKRALADSPAVKISKNEGLVLNSRPAGRSAKLILPQRALADFASVYKVEISGIQLVVAQEFPSASMQLVGTRFDRSIQDRPSSTAKFRAEVAGLYFELLNGIRRWKIHIRCAIQVIHGVVVVDGGQTVGHKTPGLVQSARGAEAGDPGAELCEKRIVTAV